MFWWTTINTGSLNQLVDLVNRSWKDAQWNPAINVMMNSWLVQKEVISWPTAWAVKRLAEKPVKNQYWKVFGEGSAVTQTPIQYGYEKDVFLEQHGLWISITEIMRTTWKDREIINDLTNLWEIWFRDIDLALTHRLTFAWSTSMTRNDWTTLDLTCWDGLAMISASHTLTWSATTWSNYMSWNPQFSKWALTQAERQAILNTFDNLWVTTVMDYDLIVSSDDPDTVIAVKELINSTADINSSNAGTYNVYGKTSDRKYRHVILPRLNTTATWTKDSTKNKYWFLACSQAQPIIYAEWMAPTVETPRPGNNGEEFLTWNWNFKYRSMWGTAVLSPRWIIWSKWDGTV